MLVGDRSRIVLARTVNCATDCGRGIVLDGDNREEQAIHSNLFLFLKDNAVLAVTRFQLVSMCFWLYQQEISSKRLKICMLLEFDKCTNSSRVYYLKTTQIDLVL